MIGNGLLEQLRTIHKRRRDGSGQAHPAGFNHDLTADLQDPTDPAQHYIRERSVRAARTSPWATGLSI